MHGGYQVGDGIRMKFNRVRQSVVEQTGSDPNDGAGCGRQPHAHIHVARKRTGLQAAVFGAPREVGEPQASVEAVSYTHLRAHETKANLVCRLLLEKKKKKKKK